MIKSASLMVTGMKCGGCETMWVAKLKALAGVKSATASSKDQAVKWNLMHPKPMSKPLNRPFQTQVIR